MIEVRQTVDLPKDIEALSDVDGRVYLRVSGTKGLHALNRTVELLQQAAVDLKEAL